MSSEISQVISCPYIDGCYWIGIVADFKLGMISQIEEWYN